MTRTTDTARLRVLYLLPAAGFGGAERQGLLHIQHLEAHGVDVVPVVGPGHIVPRELEIEGVLHFFLPRMPEEMPEQVTQPGGRWAAFLRDWAATQCDLARIARAERVNLVFASRSVGWISASAVTRRLRLPLVWRGGSRITRQVERIALRLLTPIVSPDLFIANCAAVANDLAPYLRGRSEVLVNAVDAARFDPGRTGGLRDGLGLDGRTPVVGLAARPAPGKGLELLAEVVALTRAALPSVHFLIAGDFPWRAHYERLFSEAGLGERVSFLGHVHDMPRFFASCDVVALTSEEHSIEGSPNALLEAMSMGRAVVATRVGGVPELVDDGEQGLLVDGGDAAGFARQLIRVLSSVLVREQLGAAGRRRVLERHDLHIVVGRLANLLYTLAPSATAPADPRRLSVAGSRRVLVAHAK